MVKNHLKRLFSPKTWPIKKKGMHFVTRPNAGGNTMEHSLPLTLVVRDLLGYAQTTKEVKYILFHQGIVVDGKQRKDHRYSTGLFAVVSFPSIKKSFRLLFNKRYQFSLQEIDEQEAQLKPLKITGKTKVKGKTQLHCSDGRNLLVEKDTVTVGDTIIYHLTDKKIAQSLKLEKGMQIMLIGGKHLGDSGKVEEIVERRIIYKNKQGKQFETLKKYAFVIGKEKAVLSSLAG